MEYIPPKRGEPVVNDDKSFTLRTQTFLENLASSASGGDSNYVVANAAITPATKTKITYDSKGLVTVGADATTTDIAEGSNLYYTDSRVSNYLSNFNGIIQGIDGTVSAVTVSDYLDYTDGTLAGTGEVNVIDAAGDTTTWIPLIGVQTGKQTLLSDDGITYNATTGHITSKMILNAGGTVAGSAPMYFTSSGTVDGSLLATPAVGATQFDFRGISITNNTMIGVESFYTFAGDFAAGVSGLAGGGAVHNIFSNQIPLFSAASNALYHEFIVDIIYRTSLATTATFALTAGTAAGSSGWVTRASHSALSGAISTSTAAPVTASLSTAHPEVDIYTNGSGVTTHTFSAVLTGVNQYYRLIMHSKFQNQSGLGSVNYVTPTISITGAGTITINSATNWRCGLAPNTV